MAAQDEFPKGPGDILFDTEVNAFGRIVGAEYSNTSFDTSTSEENLTSVITIPADTIGTGIIVFANVFVENPDNVATTTTFRVKADGSNPPTTVKDTRLLTSQGDDFGPDGQRGMKFGASLMMVITGLTANVANYVKITGQMGDSNANLKMQLSSIVVMAY